MKTLDLSSLTRVTGGMLARPSIEQIGRPYEPRPLAPNAKPDDQVPRPADLSRFYA